MLASLTVFVMLIGLILLSVVFLCDEVADGPLQISITLATLFATGVAYYYGFRGAGITRAVTHSINQTIGVIFILLAVGSIIGALLLAGTVPAIIYYGVAFLQPQFFYIMVFILCSLVSIMIGSAFTTAGALGVAFIGLGSIIGASSPITAGAVVSGAFVGDKICRFSDSFVMTTAAVGDVSSKEHARMVTRTAIPVLVVSGVLFAILGFTQNASAPFDPAQVQAVITQHFNISLIAFVPLVLILVLSFLKLSGFLTLMITAIASVVIAGFTQQTLITKLANAPNLPYFAAVLKVGIGTFAAGFHLNSGVPQVDQIFSGGGTLSMLNIVWLILVASSFAAVMEHTGMVQRVMAPIVNRARKAWALVAASSATCIALNVLTADYIVGIVLTARMYRSEYIKRKIKPVVLSTVIEDSGSIFSAIIPWNVHGAFVAGLLGVSVFAFAPFTFMCYISPLITILFFFIYFNKKKLSDDADTKAVNQKEVSDEELVNSLNSA